MRVVVLKRRRVQLRLNLFVESRSGAPSRRSASDTLHLTALPAAGLVSGSLRGIHSKCPITKPKIIVLLEFSLAFFLSGQPLDTERWPRYKIAWYRVYRTFSVALSSERTSVRPIQGEKSEDFCHPCRIVRFTRLFAHVLSLTHEFLVLFYIFFSSQRDKLRESPE